MAADGQEAGQPPRLMLITELPDVRARIPSVFSFSCATPCGGAGTLAGASARSRSFEYLHGFRRVAPSRRKKEKPFGGSRRSAVPCSAHLRQPRNQLEPGRGRHREFLPQPPTPGHLVDAARRTRWRWPRLSRSRQAPGGSHYRPLTCLQIHSTAPHSCFWANNQSLKDNSARCAGGRRGGGGAAPPWRRCRPRDAAPGRRGHTS